MVQDIDYYAEYATLQHLEQHKPGCPAPRPLGCMKMGRISLIFLKSDKPIKNLAEFEDFLFSSPRSGGLVFVELLRQLLPGPPSPANIVSTHGDLRPDNIIVEMGEWVMMGNALLLDLSIGSIAASTQIIMKLSGLPIAWHHMMMMIGFCICLIVFHQKDMPIGGSLIECERPGFFDTPAGLSKLQGFSMRTRLPIMRSC